MKAYSQIQDQKELIFIKEKALIKEHNKLGQIEMLSGEGSKLRERINKLKGFRKALEWVTNNQLNGELYDVE